MGLWLAIQMLLDKRPNDVTGPPKTIGALKYLNVKSVQYVKDGVQVAWKS
jgi:hypothetical protein